MPLKTKVGGVIKEMSNCKVKIDNVWKQGIEVLTKADGKWKSVWQARYLTISTTSNYYIEKYHTNLDWEVSFVGLEIAAYDANDNKIAEIKEGTESNPEVISSASWNILTSNNESLGDFSIVVDYWNQCIKYTITKTSSTATRIEVKIEKIIL